MADRYSKRANEKGDIVTNVAGIAGVALDTAKAVEGLATFNPFGLINGVKAISKTSSLVKEEMRRNRIYRDRIMATESLQRKINLVFIIIFAIISIVMFLVNNYFCNNRMSWMMIATTVTLIISCIGTIYSLEDSFALLSILVLLSAIIDGAFVVGIKILGITFADSIKPALVILLFCTIGIVIGLVINRISAEIADSRY